VVAEGLGEQLDPFEDVVPGAGEVEAPAWPGWARSHPWAFCARALSFHQRLGLMAM
jgi:hypothetical protein